MVKKSISRISCFFAVVILISACLAQTVLASSSKISQARNSILRVICDSSRYSFSTGTAFVVAQSENATYLVTNYHVIEDDPDEIYIITDDINGDWLPAQVEYFEYGLDLVILTVSGGLEDRPALPLVRTKNVDAAETVYALGFPGAADEVIDDWDLLLSSVDDVTVTNGIVSNASRKMENGIYVIQSTVPITYGNSGGPLLNENAEVIGVNTWIYTEGAYGLSYSLHIDYIIDMCITYAIPYITEATGQPYEPPEGYERPEVTVPERADDSTAQGITEPDAVPEPGFPIPRREDSEVPLSRGFLYDNLGFVVAFGSFIIIALITIVIILAVRSRKRTGTAVPGYPHNTANYGAAQYPAVPYSTGQYGTYMPPAPVASSSGWFSRNKLAIGIIAGGLTVALIVGVAVPVILSSRSGNNIPGNTAVSELTASPSAEHEEPASERPGTTPSPEPFFDPVAYNVFIGSWKLTNGHYLYHFGESDSIAFFSSGDVYSSEEDKWALWYLSDNNQLVIIDDADIVYNFTFDIAGSVLTVEDSDGDKSFYENANTSIIGDWSFSEGDWIWVFGRSSLLTFLSNRNLYISEGNETTTWEIDSDFSDLLMIYDSEFDVLREFRFCIVSDVLVIVDEDGDVAGFTRK